jgi:hypothetical protein
VDDEELFAVMAVEGHALAGVQGVGPKGLTRPREPRGNCSYREADRKRKRRENLVTIDLREQPLVSWITSARGTRSASHSSAA